MNFKRIKIKTLIITIVFVSGKINAQSYQKTDSGLKLSADNLNFEVNPNFNSDIGGFFGGVYKRNGGSQNKMFQELYVRWLQYGTFTPMMRSHGTDVPREIYQSDRKVMLFMM